MGKKSLGKEERKKFGGSDRSVREINKNKRKKRCKNGQLPMCHAVSTFSNVTFFYNFIVNKYPATIFANNYLFFDFMSTAFEGIC
jgi:hypothetical protein